MTKKNHAPTHYRAEDWAHALRHRDDERMNLYRVAIRWSETLAGEDERALRLAARSCRTAEAALQLIAHSLDGDE